MFSKNSFAYIPKRTVQQAIHQCWANCNKYNWVVDIDIKGFFDNIDHNLMIFALKQFTDKEYILIYVQRWVKAKYSYGLLKSNSGKGIPQGAVISPLLANIFLHVVFDKWFEDMYPQNKFERYADDIIIHCDQYNEAKHLFKAVKHRMKAFKLRLNEQKSKIVYCLGNQLQHPFFNPSYQNFNFLGYTFKTIITNKDNKTKLAFMPIINQKKNTGKENIPKRFNIHQKLRFSFRKTIKYSYYKIKGRIIFLYKYLRFKIRKLIRQLSYRIIFRLLNQNFRYHM